MAVGQYSWNLPASTTRAEHVAGNRKRNGILSWNRKRGERGKEGGKEEGERGKAGGKEEGEKGQREGRIGERGQGRDGTCREEGGREGRVGRGEEERLRVGKVRVRD